ncbi:hypothetical protein CRG98_021714 [Punica granatum]|uniref:Uncharacterized protein n=1 Tax=Punica granatum TaxID=22663 RepID=A0A2I0JNK5_PUNGR|nr:hypothetical protein CRG98_021714 [Punica granatum]
MARLAKVVGRNGTHRVGSGGYRNTGWFTGGFGRFWPWQGVARAVGVGWGLRGFLRERGLRERLRVVCGNHAASRKGEPEDFGHTKKPHGPYCKGDGRGFLGGVLGDGAAGHGGEAAAWAVQSEPRVEPWLGVEPRLEGLAWLSCGSHSTERKAEKRLKLD